jgi:hypothetical protein
MSAALSYVARGDRSRRADTLRGSLYVICPRRGSGAYSAKLFAGTGGGATGLVVAGIDMPVAGSASPLRLSRCLALDSGANAIEVVAITAPT